MEGPRAQGLGLIMTSYLPSVRCSGATGPPLDSCYSIISLMPASMDQQLFSRSEAAHVDVVIPDSFTSGLFFDFLMVREAASANQIGGIWYRGRKV